MRTALIFSGLFAAVTLVAVLSRVSQDPSELLETVAVNGQVNQQGLRLFAMAPNGQVFPVAEQENGAFPISEPVAALSQAQPAMAYAAQPAVRYAYVPVTNNAYGARVQAPINQRLVGYAPVSPQQLALQKEEQEQREEAEQEAEKEKARQARALAQKRLLRLERVKEINTLRKALDEAEDHEQKFESEVREMKQSAEEEHKTAIEAKVELARAQKLKQWAKVEDAAASQLEKVEASAEERVKRQSAIVNGLLPKVRMEITKRRVLEKRIAAAEETARTSSMREAMEREALSQDIEAAQMAKSAEEAAAMSYREMAAKVKAMQAEAQHDKVQARVDIQQARASVVGARTSAAKTLAAIRASMSKGALANTDAEENFARDARHATKEMSSKKKDAKALREAAVRLKASAKRLEAESEQRRRELPQIKQQAKETEERAKELRSSLLANEKQMPPSHHLGKIRKLARAAEAKSAEAIRSLSKSELKMSKARIFLSKAERTAMIERVKARRDAHQAAERILHAEKTYVDAKKHEHNFKAKVAQLKTVLADAGQELAQLKSEANIIAKNE